MAHVCHRLHDLQQGSKASARGVAFFSSSTDCSQMRGILRPAAAVLMHNALPERLHMLQRTSVAARSCASATYTSSCQQQHHQQFGLQQPATAQHHCKAPWVAFMQVPLHGQCSSSDGFRRTVKTAAAAREVSTAETQPLAEQQQQQQGEEEEEPDKQQDIGDQPTSREPEQKGKPARRGPRYSPLHHNIEDFCRRVVPTREERAAKQRVIETVNACTRRGLENMSLPLGARVKVQPFGSYVSGLSTWNSDVDIVISGLVQPSRLTGGFSPADKRFVTKVLDKVARELRRVRKLDLRSLVIIRTARIPIIKLQTGPTNGSVVADISLGDDSGPAAARYVTQQIAAYPPLAPLVLVLKVYLRRCSLNEVANGGVSSYSLTLMVLAHLQEEIKAGNDVFDLGEALYGFLLRYGEEFDYAGDAVSVASGGVVPKVALGAPGYASASGSYDDERGGGSWAARERLMVDDPLTGRDISAGTYRVDALRLAFSRAARRLEALARGKRDDTTNYLQGLFDVESALLRSPKDLHGQGFPGAAEAGGRGAGAKGGSARRQRAGGRGGRGGAPREVYVDEEFDLEDFEGDEMQYEEGALQLDVMDKWEEEEGEGEGEEGRQQRRRQRH